MDNDEDSITMFLVLNKYYLAQNLVNNRYQLEPLMTQEYISYFAEANGFLGAEFTSYKDW